LLGFEKPARRVEQVQSSQVKSHKTWRPAEGRDNTRPERHGQSGGGVSRVRARGWSWRQLPLTSLSSIAV